MDIVTDIPLSEKQINRIKYGIPQEQCNNRFYKTDNLNTPYLFKNLEFPKVSDIDKALKEVIATTSTPSETKLTMAEKEAIAMQKAEEAQAKMETALPGKTGVAKDNEGNEIAFIYKVVDANDLIASHNTNMYENPVYPSELQPRDRTRIASALQVENIINNLQPEFLGENIKITDGAPIVGSDGIVESGNGRIIALQKMYETNHPNSEKYINWLRNNAETFGIDPYNMPSNPVLVRERTTDVDRVAFTRKQTDLL